MRARSVSTHKTFSHSFFFTPCHCPIMTDETVTPPPDENRLIAERRDKLRALREKGIAFPNDFAPDAFAGDLQKAYEQKDAAAIESENRRVKVAGRVMLRRGQGKVSFIQIQDLTGPIQLFVQANNVGDAYEDVKGW